MTNEIRNIACTQTAIRFITRKYKILQLQPNGHSFFYREMQNFTVVPKRPFTFLKRNAKFWKLCPNGYSLFYNEIQDFESCTQAAFRISHKEIQSLTIDHQFSFVS